MNDLLSPLNKQWLDNFVVKKSRKPRVLHIGNIANNAYNNAKILNEAGLENYVICYDYYHIMGCPEWEDADFPKFTGDQFKPQWFKLQVSEFLRPEWFIQGPMSLCLRYFNSKMLGRESANALASVCQLISGVTQPDKKRSSLLLSETRFMLCKHLSLSTLLKIAKTLPSWPNTKQRALQLQRWCLCYNQQTFISSILALYKKEFSPKSERNKSVNLGKLRPSDVVAYLNIIKKWRTHVFSHCDFIIGYSTDPILPLLSGCDYFAFEHGTIRAIPYQDSPQGRLTALAYRRAKHVFVTNFDCRASADFLAPGRYTMINHPFDEDHGEKVTGREELRRGLQRELDSDFLLFHPTRQDWVEGTGYADKANDLFLKAFCALRNQGLKIGLVCCEWGNNVSASKQLVAQEKCSRYVKWVQPLPVVAFERTCLACDIVADQFKLGSFGGVLFKAMAVGRPILTFLDEEQVLQQYAECPPVLNCRTQKEIIYAISSAFGQREELARLGKLSREWIKKHHGKAATVNAQVNQFRLFDLSRKKRNNDSSPYLRR